MKKIKINGYLRNITNEDLFLIEDINGTYNNNILEYVENDSQKTKIKIIIDDIISINRDNDNINMNLFFDLNQNKIGTYIIKDIDKKIIFDILSEKQEINNDSIFIKYQLTQNEQLVGIFEYSITFKEE
jgi:uncharacterized beta-barrel protein YwiB (DUF1934 family)